jgi:hypothetical protein
MKRLILLNAPILTVYGKFEFEPISVDEARKVVRQAERVESAIGHAATAEVISGSLDFSVVVNRIELLQAIEDLALVFRLKKRLSEGKILNAEEIEKVGYEFGLLKRIA